MQQVFLVSGSKAMIAEMLTDITARMQIKTPIVFIDSARLFDPGKIIERTGKISNITVTYPTSPYKLRALIDTKLRRIIDSTYSNLIIISSISELFAQVSQHELPRIVDYVFEQLEKLCEDYELILVMGNTGGSPFIEKKAKALADVSLDLFAMERSHLDKI